MRILLAFLLPAIAANAANTTAITETQIQSPTGRPASGYVVISAVMPFTAADGARIERIQQRASVINGRLEVALEPTDTASIGAQYVVTWHLDNAAPRTEFWCVPTTGSTLSAAAVVSAYGTCTHVVAAGATWASLNVTWASITNTWSTI